MTTRRAAVIVILVTLASLLSLTTAEFTTWDDPHNVTRNPAVLQPSLASIAHQWIAPTESLYIPITYTIWILLGTIARVQIAPGEVALNPWIFHGANLLAHTVAALLVLRILRRLRFDPWPACIGAMIFAIHPVQVEAVGWVSGLKDVLAGMFSLLAIDRYLAPRGPSNYAAALIAFALAMLCKPSAVALPVILVVIDALILLRSPREIARSTIPFFVLAIPIVIVGRCVQPASQIQHVAIWQRPFVVGDAIAFYLGKIVWPLHLGIDYGRTPRFVLAHPAGYFLAVVPIALAMAAWIAYRRGARTPAVCICIFFVALLPVLGFIPFEFQDKSTVADHYLYLAMLGVAIACAALARWRPIRFTLILAIIALSIQSFLQARTWRDSRSVYLHAIDVNPRTTVGYRNLFIVAMSTHDGREAEWAARKQSSIAPDEPQSYLNIGAALAMQDRFGDAVDAYRAAVNRWRDNTDAHFGLALSLASAGRRAEARAEYDVVAKLDPNHSNLQQLRAIVQQNISVPTSQP